VGAKLVRDRIEELPWRAEQEKKYLRPVRGVAEHVRLLRRKILEEVGELISASTPDEAVEEAADVMEAMAAYLSLTGVVDTDVVNLIRDKKYNERGGFEQGIVYEGQ